MVEKGAFSGVMVGVLNLILFKNTPFCMTFCFMFNVLCMCFAMKRRILHMSIDHHPSIIIDMKTFINKTVYKVSYVCCILTTKSCLEQHIRLKTYRCIWVIRVLSL